MERVPTRRLSSGAAEQVSELAWARVSRPNPPGRLAGLGCVDCARLAPELRAPATPPPPGGVRLESRSLRWHKAHLLVLEKVKELPLNRDAVGDPLPQLLSSGETSCIFLVSLYQTCKRKYCLCIYFLLGKSNIEKRSDSQGISQWLLISELT